MRYVFFIVLLSCDFGPTLKKTIESSNNASSNTSNNESSENSNPSSSESTSSENLFSWSLVDIMNNTQTFSLTFTLSPLEYSASIILNSEVDLTNSNFTTILTSQCLGKCSVDISNLPNDTGSSYLTFLYITLDSGITNVTLDFPVQSISTNTGTIKKNKDQIKITLEKL